ncbi:MAG: tetratricopeptide repeat protein [Gammaproteobacteria bacterium]|nr:tetratricopeptide repeat protein [Gammaproteobacteria bacterium]MCP5135510.1 tetratricopeptide repeat protein [Gammaproteobacteria bacterium]
MRPWLIALLLLFALLSVNAVYLAAITLREWQSGESLQDGFYLSMFLAHLGLGLVVIVPFTRFGVAHLRRAWKRANKDAVRAGLGLFISGWVVVLSGLVLTRFGFLEVNDPDIRTVAYWLHVVAPLLVVWLFVLHRLAGPSLQWRKGVRWGVLTVAVTLSAGGIQHVLHAGTNHPVTRFEPGLAKVIGGERIPAEHLIGDDACAQCHADIAAHSKLSVHRFSSFNNPAYRFSIEDTRKVMLKRDGSVQATRLCAACHDLVPLFSGAFDDPNFDGDSASAQAGITCLGCHAIQRVDSPLGNGDYSIVDPPRYPFAHSESPVLKAINRQLIKAKPAFHKATLLKPVHKTAEFCSACHKVHLPQAFNHYKWLRGQDHYDSFLFSGVSGHRIDSFYYPPKAVENCAACHMPVVPSDDPAARDITGTGVLSIHKHSFAAANTGVAALRGEPTLGLDERSAFLKDAVRLDLFALRRDGRLDGALIAPLRPTLPSLEPGKRYLLDTVIRTLKLGHHLTQGTADSNELWLEITVRMGDRVIARSGALNGSKEVDPDAYFLNAWLLDRDGNRIDRRNAQDIFVALYDHQIPPGAASVVHYQFDVPAHAAQPITIDAALQYRKFTSAFLKHVQGTSFLGNDLPVITLARDRITLPVQGIVVTDQQRDIPLWQRWNDYGIGLLRNTRDEGANKGELRQAAQAFTQVEALGFGAGALNLARVHFREGALQQASDDLIRAGRGDHPAPAWTRAWFSARIDRQLGNLERATETLAAIAETRFNEARERGFDFGVDTRVRNLLGRSLFDLARRERGEARKAQREDLLDRAEAQFLAALKIDPEDLSAHYNLAKLYAQRGDEARADAHRALHARYKPDDQAVERAVSLARGKDPIANRTAEAIAIYPLHTPALP